jgi:hypothetical protein
MSGSNFCVSSFLHSILTAAPAEAVHGRATTDAPTTKSRIYQHGRTFEAFLILFRFGAVYLSITPEPIRLFAWSVFVSLISPQNTAPFKLGQHDGAQEDEPEGFSCITYYTVLCAAAAVRARSFAVFAASPGIYGGPCTGPKFIGGRGSNTIPCPTITVAGCGVASVRCATCMCASRGVS